MEARIERDGRPPIGPESRALPGPEVTVVCPRQRRVP